MCLAHTSVNLEMSCTVDKKLLITLSFLVYLAICFYKTTMASAVSTILKIKNHIAAFDNS